MLYNWNIIKGKLLTGTKQERMSVYSLFLLVLPYSIIPLIWLIPFDLPTNLSGSIAKATIVTLSKDLISIFAYTIITIMKREFRKTIKLMPTRAGMYAMASGVFGGPIGYTLFNAAFFFSGASYSHIFVSLEPIILTLSGIFIFKRKYNYKFWMGVLITVGSIMCLVIGDALGGADAWKIIVGALLGIGGATSWAIEVVLMDRAYDLNPDKNAVSQHLTLKMLFAGIVGFAVIMPLTSVLAVGNASRNFELFGRIFIESKYLWRFLVAGILIVLGRLWYFHAVKYQGGTIVAIVYNFTIIITPLFAVFWYLISNDWIDPSAHGTEGQVLWITSPFIIFGVTLVIINKPVINRNQILE
ncbi:MAG: DMT family transporter [Mycoplasma sp.]|nr:DMT family transporter [Mycoplasma sp.]